QSLHGVGDMLLDAGARRRDLIAMLVGWSEPENLLEEWLRGAPHRKLVEVVDLLGLRRARGHVDQIVHKRAGPGIARFWIGREPDDSRSRRRGGIGDRSFL